MRAFRVSARRGGFTRRRFLGGAVALLASLGRRGESRAADGGALAAPEVDTLVALVLVLLPHEAASAETAQALLEGQVAESPWKADAFREGARFLDARSRARFGAGFAALVPDVRQTLVGGLLRPYTTRTLLSNPYYYLSDHGRGVRRLWSEVVQPVLAGFYRSAAGWRVVGYPRPPGQCANLIDYQFPPRT